MAMRFNRFQSFTRKLFSDRTTRLYDPARGAVGKQFVELEDRATPAIFTVTNILDNQVDVVGGLSLRQAILSANATPGFDEIRFNLLRSPNLPLLPDNPNESYYPIVLASTLPDLTDPAGVSIDATTQPRVTKYVAVADDPALTPLENQQIEEQANMLALRPLVQLLPDPNPGAFPGYKGAFFISGSNNVIRGLVITGFPGAAINITGKNASNNLVLGNWLNTDITGTRPWSEDPRIKAARPANTPPELTNAGPNVGINPKFVLAGIAITDGANRNTIGGVIDNDGAPLVDAGGTLLGTGGTIARTIPNTPSGTSIGTLQAPEYAVTPVVNRNIISGTPEFRKDYYNFFQMGTPAAGPGGTTARDPDLVGSGVGAGIRIMDHGTSYNLIQGNFIGTDFSGNNAVPNHNGIEVLNGADSNYIGNENLNFTGDPVQAGYGNLIRFNEHDGVRIASLGAASEVAPPANNAAGEGYDDQNFDSLVTDNTPGAFGPISYSGVKPSRDPFIDALNPNYYIGASPIGGPKVLSAIQASIDYTVNETQVDPTTRQALKGISAQVGQVVTIRGTGLSATTAVTFNSSKTSTTTPTTVQAKFKIISDGEIKVTVPLGAVTPPTREPGDVDIPAINVFTPGGSAVVQDAVILPSPPAQLEIVSNFSPSEASVGQVVTIFGTNFTGTQSVAFGGVLASKFVVSTNVVPGSPTPIDKIEVTIPVGAKTGFIAITTPGGAAQTNREFRVAKDQAPVVTALSATSALPGQEIIITGVNFTGAYLIRFNYTGGTSGFSTSLFTIDSDNQIRVKVPVLATATSAQFVQVVTNDGTTFDGISPTKLAITAAPIPTVASIAPATGQRGTFVTITGTGFNSASRVTFSNVDAVKFTVINDTTITAVVPNALPLGVASVVRVASSTANSAGTGVTFTPSAAALPTVQPIPLANRNTFTIINGTNLLGTTKVLFGHPVTGTPSTSVEVLSATQLRVLVPPSVASNGNFFVFTAYNTENPLAVPATNTFAVPDNFPPTITMGRQTDPIAGVVGEVITLRGTGFTGTQDVKFINNRVPSQTASASLLEIVSDTEIRFTVPLDVRGFTDENSLDITNPNSKPSSIKIQVITPGVPDANVIVLDPTTFLPTTAFDPIDATAIPFELKLNPPPTFTGKGFFPQSGPVGTEITIGGTGFTGLAQIAFNDGTTSDFTVVSDTLLRVRVPQIAAEGNNFITLFGPGGSGRTDNPNFKLANIFFNVTTAPAPTIQYSTPQAARNKTVTITGTNLQGTSKVLFNDQAAEFTVLSNSLVRATVPLTAGPGEIRIFTPSGNAVSPTQFALAPAVAPVIGPVGGNIGGKQNTESPNAMPVGSQFTINSGFFQFADGSQLDSLSSVFAITFFNRTTGFSANADFVRISNPAFDANYDPHANIMLVTVPELPVGDYIIGAYSATQNANAGNYSPELADPPFYIAQSTKQGSNFDVSVSNATNILGRDYVYGDVITIIPNARPVVTAVKLNDVGATAVRGAPITIRGSGFTGANLIKVGYIDNDPTSVDDFVTIQPKFFTVLSDTLIETVIPEVRTKGTGDLFGETANIVFQVITPNGITPVENPVAAPTDDLVSLQFGAEAQIAKVLETQPLEFTTSGDGSFYGKTVNLVATTGSFYSLVGVNPTDIDDVGINITAPDEPNRSRLNITSRLRGNASDFWTGGSLGVNLPAPQPFPVAALAKYVPQDAGEVNVFIVPGTGGLVAQAVIPTTHTKIPDPPPLLNPPLANFFWTARTQVGDFFSNTIKLNRPQLPTINSIKAAYVEGSIQPPNTLPPQLNREVVITGTNLLSTTSVTVASPQGNYSIPRDQLQVTATSVKFQLYSLNNIEVGLSGADPVFDNEGVYIVDGTTRRFTFAHPSGGLTVVTPDGNATGNVTLDKQTEPSILALSQPVDAAPTDVRIVANRIFQNGINKLNRDANGFVDYTNTLNGPVTFNSQTQRRANGELGVDFVTTDPDLLSRLGGASQTATQVQFPFYFGQATNAQGGNGGRGGIDDGNAFSFSQPISPSKLPEDPDFNKYTQYYGTLFDTGLNTFNNSQYGRYFGPNNLQNFPLLQVVESTIDRTTFSTALLGKPFRSYRIDYYYSPGPDNTLSNTTLEPFLDGQRDKTNTANFEQYANVVAGLRFDDNDATARATTNIGEAQIYLGSKVIATDFEGNGAVSFNIYRALGTNPTNPLDQTTVLPQQPGEFRLPGNIPLQRSIIDDITGVVTTQSGVITATATDLTAPGADGPDALKGPDGTSRLSFFQRVDTTANQITGNVVVDKNGNNIFDVGEAGVAGATVKLYVQRDDATYYANTADTSKAITTIGSSSGLVQITSPAHGLASGDVIVIPNVVGNNTGNILWTVTVVDDNTFTLNASTGIPVVANTFNRVTASAVVTTGADGKYTFGRGGNSGDYGLPNGIHFVTVTLPSGGTTTFTLTGEAAGVPFTDPLDNDIDAKTTDGRLRVGIINGEDRTGRNFFVSSSLTGNNTPPTISNIANTAVSPGSTVGPINFTVGDLETPLANLVVTATSSNNGVIDSAAIILGGSGGNRTITLPTTGVTGNTTITVTVTDAGNLSASDTFVVSVGVPPNNTPPDISNIGNQVIPSPGQITIPFTVADAETALDDLLLTRLSSNPAIIPTNNAVFGGSGPNRTVTITVPSNVQGTTSFTLTVQDDGGLTDSTTFSVFVPPPAGTAPKLVVVGSDAGRPAQVNVYNPDGSLRYNVNPYGTGFTGGVRVATGDVNGDGNADVITAPGPGAAGLVKVYSGVSGEFITSFLPYGDAFKGGIYVATGDVDGDGTRDIVTGVGNSGGPRVRVYRGGSANGQMTLENLADFFPYESSFRGGVLVAVGDVNGDGRADLVTGTGVRGGPRVRVLDAARLNAVNDDPAAATLYDFFAYDSRFRGGVFASVGDVDGDGQAEILTGTGAGGGPVVKVFKQSTLAAAAAVGNGSPAADKSFFAYQDTFRGGVRLDVADVNGDNKADIITAPGNGLVGDVRVIDFGTLQDFYRLQPFESSFRGGVFVGGNLNNAPILNFITATPSNFTILVGNTGVATFRVADDLNRDANLINVIATSSNQAVVPNGNINLFASPDGSTRNINYTGLAAGSATITVTATDTSGLVTTRTFLVTVV